MKNPALLLIALVVSYAGTVYANDHHRIVFVTSVTGSGDLSTWADAGGETGLAAGDAVCQARATAAGLSNPENFVAWLSDSSDDAYCRIHGLDGKKADDCGQSERPVAAGPWVRTDGFPFSADIEGLTASGPVVFTPLRFDEYGAEVSASEIATGTQWPGTASSSNCENWTVGVDDGTRVLWGSTTGTGRRWTDVSSRPCDRDRPLLCFEREAGPELPPFEQQGRIGFVSSVSGPGDLSAWPQAESGASGLEAGDSICENLAAAAGLAEPETYKAWLSDAATDAIDRFENDGRWVRVDGVPIADGKTDLTNGLLFTAISVTEQGEYRRGGLASDSGVWTGTITSGMRDVNHCNDWTEGSDKETGRMGSHITAATGWTERTTLSPCDGTRRLYCLSDAGFLIFTDRFE